MLIIFYVDLHAGYELHAAYTCILMTAEIGCHYWPFLCHWFSIWSKQLIILF